MIRDGEYFIYDNGWIPTDPIDDSELWDTTLKKEKFILHKPKETQGNFTNPNTIIYDHPSDYYSFAEILEKHPELKLSRGILHRRIDKKTLKAKKHRTINNYTYYIIEKRHFYEWVKKSF